MTIDSADSAGDSRTFEQLLAELGNLLPRTAAALGAAHRRRQALLTKLLHGARLAGVEELLLHLDRLRGIWVTDSGLNRLVFLIDRLISDFEAALEATLSGYFSIAADAMRDVMEIEYLLLDFLADPQQLDRWLLADDKTLRRDFAPAAVRKRLHKAGVSPFETSDEAKDYAAHSAALHATPASRNDPLAGKGRLAEDSFPLDDAGFWEIFEHTRRIIIALMASGQALAHEPGRIPTDALPVAADAWRRTQEIQDRYLSVLMQVGAVGRTPPACREQQP